MEKELSQENSKSECPYPYHHVNKDGKKASELHVFGVENKSDSSGSDSSLKNTFLESAQTNSNKEKRSNVIENDKETGNERESNLDPRNNMFTGDSVQKRAPDQMYPLPTHRIVSSIPMGDFVPPHQLNACPIKHENNESGETTSDADIGKQASKKENKWVYPSEQQFYNAMKRKGWKPQESDMSVVVAIHNAVNEQSWREVLKWEAFHCDECPVGPKLLRFQGRPKEMSPKAQMKSLIGYTAPFDRHDWIVDRCGKQVRYVIDFYRGKPPPSSTHSNANSPVVAMHLDVRPALDSFSSVIDRVRYNLFGPGDPNLIAKSNSSSDSKTQSQSSQS